MNSQRKTKKRRAKHPSFNRINTNKAKRYYPKFGDFEIRNEKNQIVNTVRLERWEQKLAKKYIQPDDVVLELGARYGSVSCIINDRLNKKTNQVSVEPDKRVWNALEGNRRRNHCGFHIVKGFVSRKKLGLTNLDVFYDGYGATAVENKNSTIPSYTLEEIESKYKLHFNVLVVDCEGCMETFLYENPMFLDQLRMVMFETDYPDRCDYNKIKKILHDNGFRLKHNVYGFQYVYIRKEEPDKATPPQSYFEWESPDKYEKEREQKKMDAFIDIKPEPHSQPKKHRLSNNINFNQRFNRNKKSRERNKKKTSSNTQHVVHITQAAQQIANPVLASATRRKRCPNGTRKDKSRICRPYF